MRLALIVLSSTLLAACTLPTRTSAPMAGRDISGIR